MNRSGISRRQAPVESTEPDPGMQAVADPRNERIFDASTLRQRSTGLGRDGWPGDLEPTTQIIGGDRTTPARVSAWATLGLILGVIGVCATLTGLLAPEGFAVGVLAVLAMTGTFAWPNSATDQISRWHTWLVAHWAWLGHWS